MYKKLFGLILAVNCISNVHAETNQQKPLFVDPTRITLDQRASAQTSLDQLKPGSLTKSQIGSATAITSLIVATPLAALLPDGPGKVAILSFCGAGVLGGLATMALGSNEDPNKEEREKLNKIIHAEDKKTPEKK